MATLESAQRWGEKCKNRHFRPNGETGTQATLPGPCRLPVNGMRSPRSGSRLCRSPCHRALLPWSPPVTSPSCPGALGSALMSSREKPCRGQPDPTTSSGVSWKQLWPLPATEPPVFQKAGTAGSPTSHLTRPQALPCPASARALSREVTLCASTEFQKDARACEQPPSWGCH